MAGRECMAKSVAEYLHQTCVWHRNFTVGTVLMDRRNTESFEIDTLGLYWA